MSLTGNLPLAENIQRARGLLKALSNERRLLLLCQLTEGERSVNDLCLRTGVSQSSTSQHLARLRNGGLVKTRRSSQTIYYSLKGPEAIALIATLYKVYCRKT